MKIGTKSVLFGAHAFWMHPWFVALAWWKLYGFPFDPRLWFAFFLHDIGYWGKPNMDGPEGESHPELGASIMGALFDPISGVFICPNPECYDGFVDANARFDYWHDDYVYDDAECPLCKEQRERNNRWRIFTLTHSRFYAKKMDMPHSRLCVADKLATALTPRWLYLPMVTMTGEIEEYMSLAGVGKYKSDRMSEMAVLRRDNKLNKQNWHRVMTKYMADWAYKNK
jgi:hypothetical protein